MAFAEAEQVDIGTVRTLGDTGPYLEFRGSRVFRVFGFLGFRVGGVPCPTFPNT